MQDQLRALIRKHCETVARRVQALGAELGRLSARGTDHAAVLRAARESAHQITGASGAMGFRAVSAAAQTLERYLEELAHAGPPLPSAARQAVMRLYADLQATAQAATPESSTLYNADLSQVIAPLRHGTRDLARR